MGIQINQLTAATPSAGQSVPVYDPSKGDARRWSLSDLLAWLQSMMSTGILEPDTVYSAPADGATVSLDDNDNDKHLIVIPAIGLAALTIELPAVGFVRDKQTVVVNCTQAVGALTLDGNGATVGAGAPAALLADEFFTLKYDITLNTWYRVG